MNNGTYGPRDPVPAPVTQEQLIKQMNRQAADTQTVTVTTQMAQDWTYGAESYGTLAIKINAVPYHPVCQYLPFTPGELMVLSQAATILRKKGVEIADALVAGRVTVVVDRDGKPNRPLARDNGKME